MSIAAHIFLAGVLWTAATAGAFAPAPEQSTEYKEGYEWARDNGIEDNHACETEVSGFNEGCQAFIEESKAPAPAEQESIPEGFDFPDDQMTVLE
jgi:hypothetical protein